MSTTPSSRAPFRLSYCPLVVLGAWPHGGRAVPAPRNLCGLPPVFPRCRRSGISPPPRCRPVCARTAGGHRTPDHAGGRAIHPDRATSALAACPDSGRQCCRCGGVDRFLRQKPGLPRTWRIDDKPDRPGERRPRRGQVDFDLVAEFDRPLGPDAGGPTTAAARTRLRLFRHAFRPELPRLNFLPTTQATPTLQPAGASAARRS